MLPQTAVLNESIVGDGIRTQDVFFLHPSCETGKANPYSVSPYREGSYGIGSVGMPALAKSRPLHLPHRSLGFLGQRMAGFFLTILVRRVLERACSPRGRERMESRRMSSTNPPEELTIRCLSCQQETTHRVVAEHRRTDSSDDMHLNLTWQITECAGCSTVTFVERSVFSEDLDEAGNTGERMLCHPKRDDHTRAIKPFPNVPPNLRRIYREMMDCFNGDSPTLCAAGLRAIVDGICADQNVLDGPVTHPQTEVVQRRDNLQGRIAGLAERNLLTRDHADILHQHRFLGNDAVHELAAPAVDNLQAAIQVIEHTLENIYELPITAQRIRP